MAKKKTETKEKYRINFDAPHTKYFNKDKVRLPGVTTLLGVLAKQGLYWYYWDKGCKGKDYNEKDPSAKIGTIIHAMILCHFSGMEFDSSNLTEEEFKQANDCLKSFMEYIKNLKIKPLILEEPMVSEKYQYGGTPDLICDNNGEIELWDFKSGKDIYDDYISQVAGYYAMVEENKLLKKKKIWNIILKKIGQKTILLLD